MSPVASAGGRRRPVPRTLTLVTMPHHIRTFPSVDRAFRRAVERAAREAASPSEIAKRLRPTFPRVEVRERELSNEPRILYAYRDGRVTPLPDDPWWEQDDSAHLTIDVASGRFVRAAGNVGLIGTAPEDVLGRPFTDFVGPDGGEAAAALWETLLDEGAVATETTVHRPDGTAVLVDVVAHRRGEVVDLAYRRAAAERRRYPRAGGAG